MTIRLLLDEHISPQVAMLLRKRGINAVALHEWHSGQYLGRSDEEILRAAHGESRAFVTYDVRTIPTLLQNFAESGAEHSGVVFVSVRTFPQGEIAPLAEAALARLADMYQDEGLQSFVLFLSKS